ncbi:MAG TPA: DMT family transporter [Bacillota bacterium]|nr:DMT family transporter [Bacillota bacterium]
MSPQLLFLLVAAISGVAMAIQGTLNSALGKVIGLFEATLVVHVIGAVLVAVLLFGFRVGQGHSGLGAYTLGPWYNYLGGILSVAIIYLVAVSIPRLGVCNATTAIIVGQVLAACLIDHLGLFGVKKLPMGIYQILGLGLLATGAKLLLK